MNPVGPIAGQVTRGVAGVWICDGRSGGGSGTKSVRRQLEAACVSALGITYLDLFLTERDAIHNTGAGCLVWFGIPLVFGLEYCVIFWAAKIVPIGLIDAFMVSGTAPTCGDHIPSASSLLAGE